MHTLRGNLTPVEAGTALANVAEASIAVVLSAVEEDFVDRRGPHGEGGIAAVARGDLASGEASPGTELDLLFVYEGGPAGHHEALCRRFHEALRTLSRGSLLFQPLPRGRTAPALRPLADFAEHQRSAASADELLSLTRARCVFESGASGIGERFDEARREALVHGAARDALIATLREPAGGTATPGLGSIDDMQGGLRDVERAARLLQLTHAGDVSGDPAPMAASVFRAAAKGGSIPDADMEQLAAAATMWRNLQGILRLVADEGFAAETAGPGVKAALARSCGLDDFEALAAAIRDSASRAAAAGASVTERDG